MHLKLINRNKYFQKIRCSHGFDCKWRTTYTQQNTYHKQEGKTKLLPRDCIKHLFEGVVVDEVFDDGGEAVTVRELLQAQPAHASRREDHGVVGQVRVVVRIEAGLVDVPLVVIVAPAYSTMHHITVQYIRQIECHYCILLSE